MKYDSILRQLLDDTAKALLPNCTTPGCDRQVSKPGYKLCYSCWKAQNAKSKPTPKPKIHSSSSSGLLSATKIGDRLGIHFNKVNPILAELGLLDKHPQGWMATRRGLAFGAIQNQDSQTGNSYVLWPESILENQAFLTSVESYKGNTTDSTESEEPHNYGFREKFRRGEMLRTMDGHWVRSKAEVMVDNWLYTAGLVHAYERRLPIEEQLYCDFYIPAGKVFIEYWGYEDNPEYLERKRVKQQLYRKYELNLIELSETHVRNLDDCLPQMLLKFGVNVN